MHPTIGRVVHYRLPGPCETWRPALVVNAWPDSRHANLTVFLDAGNDLNSIGEMVALGALPGVLAQPDKARPFLHVLSAEEGTEPGCWRWPPRV